MGTSRRLAGRRGSCRPIGVSTVHGSTLERQLRRRMSQFHTAPAPDVDAVETGNGVITVPPHDVSWYWSLGRPIPELFGVQDLREYFQILLLIMIIYF